MELLKTLSDFETVDESNLRLREASRAILFDENDLIPMLYVSKYNYHKLPGGGIDEGESKSEALIREILEEVGSKFEMLGEVGIIIELRKEFNQKQTSYCYYGKITSKGVSSFTKSETDSGFELKWLNLTQAIDLVENKDKPSNYEGEFIQKRDLVLLKEMKKILDEKNI